MENNFKEKWMNEILNMSEAIGNDDFIKAESYMKKANSLFLEAKGEFDFFNKNISNFGLINPIIESSVQKMYMSNDKKPMVEYIKLIKKDNNLKGQYMFYESIKNYTPSADSKEYLSDCIKMATKYIDQDTIKESNDKLVSFMKKYHIVKNIDDISENKKNFFKSCQFVLETKKTLSNINKIYESIDKVSSYMDENPNVVLESYEGDKENILDAIMEFNNRYSAMDDSDKDKFSILMESGDIATEKKKKLLDSIKEQCIEKLNDLESSANTNEEKESINAKKEDIKSIVYSEETIVKDIAKLLEINDILSEK